MRLVLVLIEVDHGLHVAVQERAAVHYLNQTLLHYPEVNVFLFVHADSQNLRNAILLRFLQILILSLFFGSLVMNYSSFDFCLFLFHICWCSLAFPDEFGRDLVLWVLRMGQFVSSYQIAAVVEIGLMLPSGFTLRVVLPFDEIVVPALRLAHSTLQDPLHLELLTHLQ